MKTTRLLPAVLALLVSFTIAQDNRLPPPASLRGTQFDIGPRANLPARAAKSDLPFCPPKTCLYYAGDFDSNSPAANGLWNIDDMDFNAETWVGVRPAQSVLLTGVTFNQFLNNSQVGVNPTPFFVSAGVSSGNGGHLVCRTSGNATLTIYGQSDFGFTQYSYTIKKLSKACQLRKNKIYFVNLWPIYNDGTTIGYVVDMEDSPPPNHRGWKNVLDNSFFWSSYFGVNYQSTWGNSGACNGVGCDAFSIALTGRKQP